MSILSSARRFAARKAILALLAIGMAIPAVAQQSPARKVIQNRAEYNAYETAVQTQDAASRAASLEAFTQQYPHSVVYTDALEQEMEAWQSAGDQAKVQQAAKLLLAAEPGNVRALAIVVAVDRYSAARGDKPSLDELCLDSTAGMREVSQWQKPYGMSDSDFDALQKQMDAIFYGAAGFCALEQKNYSQAQDWLSRAFALDSTSLEDAYQLAVTDLEMKPPDADGFWYCARAIHLAANPDNPDTANAITAFCQNRYLEYHGGLDGWEAVMAAGASQDAWPAGFGATIKPAPVKPAAPAGKPASPNPK